MDDRTAAASFRVTRRRGVVALAGLTLAVGAMGTVAACGPTKTAAQPGGPAGSTVSASASPSPSASASAPTDGSAAPAPASPAPVTPTPARTPTPAPTPTGPATIGKPSNLPASSYQVADGSHLTVWFFGGICDKYGLSADESTGGQVRVQIVITQPLGPGMACAQIIKSQPVSVDLKQPLGSRAVVDVKSGQTLPVGGETPGGAQ